MKNITYLSTIAGITFLLSSCTAEVDDSKTPSSAEATQQQGISKNGEVSLPGEASSTTGEASSTTGDASSADGDVKENPFSSLTSKAADGAEVFFVQPQNGAVLTSPVTIQFGIKNMVVAKAGEQIEFSGHHHLLINLDELPNLDTPLPATDQIIHFGGAQTETSIELPAGQHQLQLLLGNYAHIPHDKPVMSEKITITIK